MTDYTEMVFESLIEELGEQNKAIVKELIAETNYALEAFEKSRIEYLDEGIKDTMKDVSKKAMDALKIFLDKVNSAYISATSKFYESYADNVASKTEQIKKKAETASIDLAPYWKPNHEADMSVVKKIFDEAFKYPYDENDIGFIKDLVPQIDKNQNYTAQEFAKFFSGNSAVITTMIKNRFRFGVSEPDNNNIKKETLKGGTLAGKIDDMVKYVQGYKQFAGTVKKTSDDWKNKAKAFDTAITQESVIAQDTYFMIEGSELKYSDLALLEGFDLLPVLELDEQNGSQDKPNDNKPQEDVKAVVDNNADKNNEGEDGKTQKKQTARDRYNMCDKFCRIVYTSYIFSVEERFVVYIKALETVLGESLKKKTEENQNNNQNQENK